MNETDSPVVSEIIQPALKEQLKQIIAEDAEHELHRIRRRFVVASRGSLLTRLVIARSARDR